MLTNLNEVLDQLIKDSSYKDVYSLFKIQSCWNQILGEQLAKYTIPYKLEKKILTVIVADSAYFSALDHKKPNLISMLRKSLGSGKIVTKIQFVVSEFQLFELPPAKKRTNSKSTKTSKQQRQLELELGAEINDPQLRRSYLNWINSLKSREI